MTKNERILLTGAGGQIGTVLTQALREKFGADRVLPTDLRPPAQAPKPFEVLDVLDSERLRAIVTHFEPTQIYHLAAILSAVGERNPRRAWEINMQGLFNVLDIGRDVEARLFFPSSIAVFGRLSPKVATPQNTILQPETVYGISKVAGESWCQYYHEKYGLDVRALRYPGIISYQSLPGGGTTDYAVEIFHQAVKGEPYTCFLKADTRLPMLYMPDAIRATLELMDAPSEQIATRTGYNLAGMSFTPEEVAQEIQKHLPDFRVRYRPDFRQSIADTWPQTIDDSLARKEWGWKPQFDLPGMTEDMLRHLNEQVALN